MQAALQRVSAQNPASAIFCKTPKKKKKKNHPDQAVPGPREATSSEKNSPMTMNLQQLFDPLNCGSVFF